MKTINDWMTERKKLLADRKNGRVSSRQAEVMNITIRHAISFLELRLEYECLRRELGNKTPHIPWLCDAIQDNLKAENDDSAVPEKTAV